MDRRTFLKSAGGLVIFGLAGALMSSDSARLFAGSPSSHKAPVGPLLRKGIDMRRTSTGSRAYYDQVHLFDVDQAGAKFLKLADGTHTIDDIAARAGMKDAAAEVALFFVTLGQAGYLQNRVVVSIVENTA